MNEGKNKSEEMVAQTKLKVGELLSEAEEILEGAKKKTSEIIHNGKETITERTDTLKTAVKAGVDAYKAEIDKKSK
jgi:F0F1-type ATP synthase membrane subunit b/b'